jgi:autotransporter-associated beta strand protein
MALVTWKAAVSGDWSTAARWSTNTVPSSVDDADINLIGNYLVTVTLAEAANSLDFNAPGAQLVESSTGKLTLGALTVENGYVELDAANTIGSVDLAGGVLATGKTGSLGSGQLTLAGGELLAVASETLANPLIFQGPGSSPTTVTIAAAHGTGLTLNGSLGWSFGPNITLDFGAAGVDGVVVWHTPAGSAGSPVAVNVRAGTLRAGDSGFLDLLLSPTTTVDSGATIDLAGISTTIGTLAGTGRVSDSGAAATLTLDGGTFAGAIMAALSVALIDSEVLTGTNSYTGSTAIIASTELTLGAGGTTGTIAASSPVIDNGGLAIDHSNSLTLANTISGTGDFIQEGTGTTTVTAANSYSDGTFILNGTLAVAESGALGSGVVFGESTGTSPKLLGTVTATLDNQLETFASSPGGTFTIAAAHGTTLTLDGSAGWSLSPNVALHFGATMQDGTVVWFSPAGSTGSAAEVDVDDGTLKAGDANLSTLLNAAIATTVAAGAAIDLGGFSATINDLNGSGKVTDSGAAATLTVEGSSFSGAITGPLSLAVAGFLILTGTSAYTGSTTIDPGRELLLGDGGTTGSIAAASPIIDDGTLTIDHSNAVTLANPISGSGDLIQAGAGTTTINTANTYSGDTIFEGGTLAVGNAGALGSGAISTEVAAGTPKLLGTVTETLTNQVTTVSASAFGFTIAAAHGTTLTLDSPTGWDLNSNVTLHFGATGQDGTVVWSSPSGSTGHAEFVDVDDGILKAGDANLSTLLDATNTFTTILHGEIDLAGFSATIFAVNGPGGITDSGAAATLTLDAGNVVGAITGPLSLTIAGSITLFGTNTYTGSTTINSGATLILGTEPSKAGSIAASSQIVDNGVLEIEHNNALTLANPISGSGELIQFSQLGTGTTTITGVNTYSGGTVIDSGTLRMNNSAALGSGQVTINGGELEGNGNLTFANPLTMNNSFTIAAAHGRTFKVGSGGWLLNEAAGNTISFGAAGQDGTVVLSDSGGASIANPGHDSFAVQAGTLKAGDSGLAFLLQAMAATAVAAGATLDIAGFDSVINQLSGGGTVTNSGALAQLTVQGTTSFGGTLGGALAVDFTAPASLSGLSDYTGGTTVEAGQVVNNGTFNLTNDSGIAAGGPGVSFVNDGLFEKTGGTGKSTVFTPFTNNGDLVVTSGSVQFAGGFTSPGVVEGVITQSGGILTVSANAPGQTTFFGGSGDNLIKVTTAPTYVDGGGGTDTLEIAGNMTLAAGSVANIEAIEVDNGVTAKLSHLTGPYTITLLSVAGGSAKLTGSAGSDTIVCGAGNDVVAGGPGADTITAGSGSDHFVYNAIADSTPGTGTFDRIAGFTAGSGTGADLIDLSKITGVTTIQGLIVPSHPSETPPATGLHANSIAWYQFGSETVVIANASATANHVDMEIVLTGVTASSLSTVAGVNFIPDPPAGGGMALLVQSAAGFPGGSAPVDGNAGPSPGVTDHQQLLAPTQHG